MRPARPVGPILASSLLLCLLGAGRALAVGDGSFHSPLVITNAGRPGPATVHAGDFDGDGKLDLVTANGSPRILIWFQDPVDRDQWSQLSLPVGSQVWFVRSADFNGDGLDDIIASDVSATVAYVESQPDRRFSRPVQISEARGARWSAIGDWNRDGRLDFATANISAADLTVFLGDGAGGFELHQRLPGSREHTLEALDYDGDGNLDLFLGTGLTGITVHRGLGDGSFEVVGALEHLGCVEYLAEVGHFVGSEYRLHGDFDGDGRGDLAPTCVETTSVAVGISRGDGTFPAVFESQAGSGVDSTAIADFDGDGDADLAIASKGTSSLLVHRGDGRGELASEPLIFAPTGNSPGFLLARDLDGDARVDLVTADILSSTITIFWGRDGERFLESAATLSGFVAARSMAVADLDGDGSLDVLFPRSDGPGVQVFLGPGSAPATAPSTTIATAGRFTYLDVADLDGDGAPDLAGADPIGGRALFALLDRDGAVRVESSLPAGIAPSGIALGELGGGAPVDAAVVCKGSDHVAVFIGDGAGSFADAEIVPTTRQPDGAAIGDVDGDGAADLAVHSATAIVVHYGDGQGRFGAAEDVVVDAAREIVDLAIADLDGDSAPDLIAADATTRSAIVFARRGAREFDEPLAFALSSPPVSLAVADLDGDGRADVTVASATGRSAEVLIQSGDLTFRSSVYGLGIVAEGHRIVDLDGDATLDLLAFGTTAATSLSGRSGEVDPVPVFVRGDVSSDGGLAINDPISLLQFLFLGAEPVPCEDAADADDDGRLGITDAIAILAHLFQGRGALPPPGPACGPDPSADELDCSRGCAP